MSTMTFHAMLQSCEWVRTWFANHVRLFTWEALDAVYPGLLPIPNGAKLLSVSDVGFDPTSRRIVALFDWPRHLYAADTTVSMYEWYRSRFVCTPPCTAYQQYMSDAAVYCANTLRYPGNPRVMAHIFTRYATHLSHNMCANVQCINAFIITLSTAVDMCAEFWNVLYAVRNCADFTRNDNAWDSKDRENFLNHVQFVQTNDARW